MNRIGKITDNSFVDFKKDKNEFNKVVRRWREIGMLNGIRLNSEIEKRVAENFQKMALYLLKNNKNFPEYFLVIVFPILRVLCTGEKFTNKSVRRSVEPEEVINLLDGKTLDDIITYLKSVLPKSKQTFLVLMSNLMKYLHVLNYELFTINTNDFKLSEKECELIGILFNYNRKIDIDAEFCVILSSYLVYKINELDKQKKSK